MVGLENKPSYYADMVHARLLEYGHDASKTRAYLQEHGIRLIEGTAIADLEGVRVS